MPGSVVVIVNPAATKVTAAIRGRLREVLEAWSPGRVVERPTPGPGTAAAMAGAAADEGAELVVSLGGDGHAADILGALIGRDVPVALIPGGNANVIARALGWPARQGAALNRLAAVLPERPVRLVRLGQVTTEDGVTRVFGLNAGIGLDAEAVARVERTPRLKHTLRHGAFVAAALSAATAAARRPPSITIDSDGDGETTTLLVSCGRPYTYLAGRPLDLLPRAEFDGHLAWVALQTARLRHTAAIGGQILLRARVGERHTRRGVAERLEARSATPVALQADGEALGRHTRFSFRATEPVAILDPRSLKSEAGEPI